MKVEITDKHGVKVDGKTYIQGQVIDKEEDNTTKQALIESGVAKVSEEVKKEKVNV